MENKTRISPEYVSKIIITDDETPLFLSYEFLKNIAEMNFTKYQQPLGRKLKAALNKTIIPGKVLYSDATNNHYINMRTNRVDPI